MSRGPLTHTEIRDVVRRVQAGEDRGEIAAGYGINRSTISTYMRRYGLVNALHADRGASARADLSWQDRAKCRNYFDPTDGKYFSDMDVEKQKRICWDGCRVRDQCRERGLECIEDGLSVSGLVFGGLGSRDLGRLYRLRREEAARAERLRAEVTS